MSRCHETYRRCASVALLLALVLIALPSLLNAQTAPKAPTVQSSDDFPKVDLFLGYQWLNPGGTVPVGSNPPFQQPPSPVATKLPGMSTGYAVAGTYNFDKWWGLSVDVSGNFHDKASESSISVGPRLMWRTEGVNFFVHTMMGLNRLSPKDVPSSNGVGAVLGGGMDVKVFRALSFRLFEADYVLGRHNFSSVAPPDNSGLRRPVLNGAALRTGLVFNFGGAPNFP